LEHRLWRIKAPTLIVWGEEDRFISPLYAEIFHQKIAGSQVIKIPNVGHAIGAELPEPYASAVLNWGGG
jgi:pimeloyl-ACP methyl ester carboxylesterase